MNKIIPVEIKIVLQQTKLALKKCFRNNLSNLILFGSYARGDNESGSDIDILMILKKLDNESVIRKNYIDLISEICLENSAVISIIPMSEIDFKKKKSPLILNVKKEGIEI